MFEHNWRLLYIPNMQRIYSLIDQLTMRLKKEVPRVYKHFKKEDINVMEMFSHVFFTAFVYKTPLELSVRIFDIFLLDKEEALISTLVKIIKLMQEKILEYQSFVLYSVTIGCK